MPKTTEQTPRRRSGRKRKVSARYNSDVFDDEEVFGPADQANSDSANEPDDEDFEANAADGDEKVEDDDEEVSDAQSVLEVASPNVRDAEGDISDIVSDSGDNASAVTPKKARKGSRASLVKRLKNATIATGEGQSHTQGLKQFGKGAPTDLHLFYYFGQDQDDINPLLEARNIWANEVTLPSRSHGIRLSPFVPAGVWERDRNGAWQWYYNGPGSTRLEKMQQFTTLDGRDEGRNAPLPKSISFFAGQSLHPSLFSLPTTRSLNLNEVWEKPVTAESTSGNHEKSKLTERRGWLVNIGESVRGIAWAPNRLGSKQYLALYSRSEASLGRDSRMKHSTVYASAFVAEDTQHSVLQIWEFASQRTGNGRAVTFDKSHQPRLVAALHFDSGALKALQWCPVPRTLEDESNTDSGRLGMLALIHGDGALRVLDIRLDQFRDKDMHILQVAFHSRPPETVCTCATWLSSTLIAAGCSNGHVAIWDLEQHFAQSKPPQNALPRWYHSLHDSYVMNITSCYPSRPHFIVTCSIDGFLRLTDIRSPHTDSVVGQRTRSTGPIMQWYEQAQHVLSADDTYNLRAAVVRKFDKITYLEKYQSPVSSLATSLIHSSVLVGLAEGIVKIANPMSRLLRSRKDTLHYAQIWFRHDWRRGQEVERTNPTQGTDQGHGSNGTSKLDFPSGISRLTSGYKVEPSHTKGPKGPDGSKKTWTKGDVRVAESGTMWTTTFEKETAINCLAWNPNICAGGWAAAGMGSGLLWVEDLAYD